ncbi:MAG TPA: hypothetical protein VFD27_12325 [Chthoniobacteraceae bacterium]|nr:hypothetical protein [Chthoniobacteraceae bacterium]
MVRFTLSAAAWSLMGLDDQWSEGTYPTLKHLGGDRYEASEGDARAMAEECEDRSGDGGFEHTASARRSLRIAAQKIRAALQAGCGCVNA